MPTERPRRIAILTSGGDAPGMNAVVRAVVRTGLENGLEVFSVEEGLQGLVEGGMRIRRMTWESVAGILQKGGTVIGTARSAAFRTREGRLAAAANLARERIGGLVAVGGDGTLTGCDLFRREWPGLLAELREKGELTEEQAGASRNLALVGVVGSIDNDMPGTDMTIGADTALHRITEAIDALTSTAASHQRTFVVEVMGRDCGYLALMSALATGASWVLIPEHPPEFDDWEARMCAVIDEGRKAGRRHAAVLLAEGARDRHGAPISAEHVRAALEERLGVEARVTVLGHVQRGGAPSAFDRTMGTLLGHAAVGELLHWTPDDPPWLVGLKENRIARSPLMENVRRAKEVAEAIREKDFERAMDLRGPGFRRSWRTMKTLVRALPHPPIPGQRQRRFAVLVAGAPAPGMNTAVRAAVRLLLDAGHKVLGVKTGFEGLLTGDVRELDWMGVHGMVASGGSGLGTSRRIPEGPADLASIAATLEKHDVEGLLVVAGWMGYEGAWRVFEARGSHPRLAIPIVLLPAAIDNNLPGAEFAIGADTAVNSIVEAVDRIKQSGTAWRRSFVVEVMGRWCGYLAAMGGLATGAERAWIPEEGITLSSLQKDLDAIVKGFRRGKRLALMIRSENASPVFTTGFLRKLFEEEGRGLFDAREAILGHLQQGGDPTPFDRIQATRMAAACVEWLLEEAGKAEPGAAFLGTEGGRSHFFELSRFPEMADRASQRPKDQWWLTLLPIIRLLAQAEPSGTSPKA